MNTRRRGALDGARQGRRECPYQADMARLRTPHRAVQRRPATWLLILNRALGAAVVRIPHVTFEEARAQFPVLDRYAYLQAGSVGPLARGTIDAMQASEKRGLEEGRGSFAQFMRLLEAREQLRAELAELVGVDVDKVAITASTTDGCNIVLAGLDLQADDEIITTTDEHFGLLGPLHMSGATVVVVEPDPERIVAAVTARTRLIAVSHVLWTTGAILPVHELRSTTGL